MPSQSQTNANRKNSQQSTGPRTAAGKARSARNSTVHGLTGASPILPGEDPADLQALTDQYRVDLHPAGQVEDDLVARLAVATYRLRRILRIEAGYLDYRVRACPVPEIHNRDGVTDPLAWAFQLDCTQHNVLDHLNRYESRIQRDYSRCLRDLHTLQAARQKISVETKPKSKATPVPPTSSGNSDVPQEPTPAPPTPAPAT
ncbi:MAG: hypothetical protein ABSF64_20165 [Bryobacteraceae bacterium]|jgi:hypothetical protein